MTRLSSTRGKPRCAGNWLRTITSDRIVHNNIVAFFWNSSVYRCIEIISNKFRTDLVVNLLFVSPGLYLNILKLKTEKILHSLGRKILDVRGTSDLKRYNSRKEPNEQTFVRRPSKTVTEARFFDKTTLSTLFCRELDSTVSVSNRSVVSRFFECRALSTVSETFVECLRALRLRRKEEREDRDGEKEKERGKSRTDVQKKPVGVNYRLVSSRLPPESDDFD